MIPGWNWVENLQIESYIVHKNSVFIFLVIFCKILVFMFRDFQSAICRKRLIPVKQTHIEYQIKQIVKKEKKVKACLSGVLREDS